MGSGPLGIWRQTCGPKAPSCFSRASGSLPSPFLPFLQCGGVNRRTLGWWQHSRLCRGLCQAVLVGRTAFRILNETEGPSFACSCVHLLRSVSDLPAVYACPGVRLPFQHGSCLAHLSGCPSAGLDAVSPLPRARRPWVSEDRVTMETRLHLQHQGLW